MKWSASNAAFFPEEMIDEYKENGWDLSDAVDVSIDVYNEYSQNPPEGKVRAVGTDGMPCWAGIPEPTIEELIDRLSSEKRSLQMEAESVIKPLDRARNLGMATDGELSMLLEWEKYSVMLMRVDTSLAPDVAFPEKPKQ